MASPTANGALGDEGAAVEHAAERRAAASTSMRTSVVPRSPQPLERRPERRRDRRIDVDADAGHGSGTPTTGSDRRPSRPSAPGGAPRPAIAAATTGGVDDRAGEHRGAVEAAHGRHDARRCRSRPTVGLSPTMPLSAAGTRPDPAVSVPSANGTSPSATATAEPELDPPGTSGGSSALRRRAVRRAGADQAGGELVEVGLADDDRAGGPRARRPRRRRGRRRRRSPGSAAVVGDAGDVDVVLDDERARRAAAAASASTPSSRGARRPRPSATQRRRRSARRPAPSARASSTSSMTARSAALADASRVAAMSAWRDAPSVTRRARPAGRPTMATAPNTPPCIVTIFSAAS